MDKGKGEIIAANAGKWKPSEKLRTKKLAHQS